MGGVIPCMYGFLYGNFDGVHGERYIEILNKQTFEAQCLSKLLFILAILKWIVFPLPFSPSPALPHSSI